MFVMFKVLAVILCALTGYGIVSGAEISDTVSVRFPQSHSVIDLDFMKNGERLDNLLHNIAVRKSTDSTLLVKKVIVTGSASPEGTNAINRRLSYDRAQSIFEWLASRIEIADSTVDFRYLGRDWNGLRELVENDSCVTHKKEVLDFIDNAIITSQNESEADDQVLNEFKHLASGQPYSYLYSNVFPELRASRVVIDYGVRQPYIVFPDLSAGDILTSVNVPLSPAPLLGEIETFSHKTCKPFYMSLNTNLLYDALALPNIGAEFYIGKQWSIGANWLYGWWDNDKSHRYWRAYGGELSLKRWFGHKASEKPLTGHHLGIYGGIITYDFELGGIGYMGGIPGGTLWDRCNYVAGVEYGYSLPIAKRLNIDFTIGVGYMGGKYVKYEPKNGCYQWISTNRLTWFGPTKAEISLVWLIGCDNYNREKGGRR